jgi:hypothetical protein
LGPEEAKERDNRVATTIGQHFSKSGAGGSFNSQIAEHVQGTLGQIDNLPKKLRDNPTSVVDELLRPYEHIKRAGESGNKDLQQGYGLEQQRQVHILNRRFTLRQNRASVAQQQGEFEGSLREQEAAERPAYSANVKFRGLSRSH